MMFAAYKYDENLKQLSFHHKYIKVIFQILSSSCFAFYSTFKVWKYSWFKILNLVYMIRTIQKNTKINSTKTFLISLLQNVFFNPAKICNGFIISHTFILLRVWVVVFTVLQSNKKINCLTKAKGSLSSQMISKMASKKWKYIWMRCNI